MRTRLISYETINGEKIKGESDIRTARRLAPWAQVAKAVGGGVMVWESVSEAKTWANQK